MKTFPLAAVVGQGDLKLALMICAVNSTVGGVLVKGEKGTAKSTAARGVALVMPHVTRVRGCKFNCEQGKAIALCEVCTESQADSISEVVPFVNLPLGASEDRVIGSLDFERALKEGQKAFQPGLLASAHRGVLYIDEVNLLPDHLVDILLDAAAMGQNRIERDGLNFSHPSHISLIGTMNPEEGDLRPQLLDRFGMMVETTAPNDPKVRTEVVRRRIDFESNPEQFEEAWREETNLLSQKIAKAKETLGRVSVSEELLEAISSICCKMGVASLRADITMSKVAQTIAALDGRLSVTLSDVRQAASLVLPHRKRRMPTEQSGFDQNQFDSMMNDLENKTDHADSPEQTNESECPDQDFEPPSQSQSDSPDHDTVFAPVKHTRLQLEIEGRTAIEARGNRTDATSARRGRFVRAVRTPTPSQIAVSDTIKYSVLRNNGRLIVTREDFHEQVRGGKAGNHFIFVLDSSGSVGALKRMELVKGAAIGLLDDIYQKRDHVSVVTFRGTEAELLVQPTRSVELVDQSLRQLPTGGRTPLAPALALTLKVITAGQNQRLGAPVVVLLTDGKANVPASPGADPWEETLLYAGQLSRADISTVVIDTESGVVRLHQARTLAATLSAQCLSLDQLDSEKLVVHLRNGNKVGVRARV